MVLPPLLLEHIEYLRNTHTIEISENDSEIFLVFHDYVLPKNIWDIDKTDLLIITHPAYPNPKIDMFWVEPHLKLINGKTPKAAKVFENKLGRNWQRFSWHLGNWNPGKDNLITYLNDVNERLSKSESE